VREKRREGGRKGERKEGREDREGREGRRKEDHLLKLQGSLKI
jgi:hypothetical protein